MLADGGVIVLEQRGRRHFARLAPRRSPTHWRRSRRWRRRPPSRTLRASIRARALREARTCYDHLAGALGVALTDALCVAGILTADELTLTDDGVGRLRGFGIDLAGLRAHRRPLTRACLDWSERRPHLAGALGAALCQQLLDRGWIVRMPEPRIVRLTPAGRAGLARTLGLTHIPEPAA
jgi:hypothetical protein